MEQAPLHAAAAAGRPDAISLLLDRGADLHAITNTTDTALHIAAREGHVSSAGFQTSVG